VGERAARSLGATARQTSFAVLTSCAQRGQVSKSFKPCRWSLSEVQQRPGHLNLPNLTGSQDIHATKKQSRIGGGRRVLAIGQSFSDKLVRLHWQPHSPHNVPDSRYWMIICTVRACVLAPTLSPSWTVRERLILGEMAAQRLGAKYLTEQPTSQLSSQNKARAPTSTTSLYISRSLFKFPSLQTWLAGDRWCLKIFFSTSRIKHGG
jgi:hypothetical protein